MDPSEICTQPIIEIFDLNEFKKYAKKASLVIYNPEFFSSPFINEKKIKSITCYLIGVRFRNLFSILKYQKTWKNSAIRCDNEHKNPKDAIDSSMRTFIDQIKDQFHAINGIIYGEKTKSIWSTFY